MLECRNEPGGTVRTLREHGCIVDAGPEAFMTTRREVLASCTDLGLSDQMLRPNESTRTWLALQSGPVPLPDGLAMGIPRRLGQLVTTAARARRPSGA